MDSRTDIRILDLLPYSGMSDDVSIECDLRIVSLSDAPQYEAVSYVWGDPDVQLSIKVSGIERVVTKNLYGALKRLRRPNEKRTLWVDQLCINQWDVSEKAAQVRLMRQIYSQCTRCLLWWGEIRADIPFAHAKSGFELLKFLAAGREAEDSQGVSKPAFMDSGNALESAILAIRAMTEHENPWWKRIWTVQEAALPANLVFVLGPFSLTWDVMIQAATNYMQLDEVEQLLSPHGNILRKYSTLLGDFMCNVIWLSMAKSRNDTPLQSVIRWRGRQATDVRDKVYGLLGMFPAGTLPTIEQCDYTLSPSTLFSSLTIDLIVLERSLRPLIMDPRLEDDEAGVGMPHWALDMTNNPQFNTNWYHYYGYEIYNASRGRQLDANFLRENAKHNPRVLALRGTFVDTIDVTGEPFRMSQRDMDNSSLLRTIRGWHEIAQNYWTQHRHRESRDVWPWNIETFGRLILGNYLRDDQQWAKRPASDADVAAALYFLQCGKTYDYDIYHTISCMVSNQTFFVTKSNLIGTGHLETRAGDEIWILNGGNVPFTLRRREGGERPDYDFVGRCYVQGIMDGEVFENESKTVLEQTLRIY